MAIISHSHLGASQNTPPQRARSKIEPTPTFTPDEKRQRREALAGLVGRAAGEARPTPQGKRERIWKHYAYCLTLILDELGAPEGIHEFVEALILKIGFNATDWTRCCDETLARYVAATDAEGRVDAAYQRIRRQRLVLIKFQDAIENPTFIQHRLEFDQEAKRQYSEYKLPIATLLRDIVEACPVGTGERTLKGTVRRLIAQFLRENKKIKQRPKKKKRQTPESKFNAALTLATQGYAEEGAQHGETSAKNAMGSLIGALNQILESPPGAGLLGSLGALNKAPSAPYVETAKIEKSGTDNKRLNPESRGQNENDLHRGGTPAEAPEFDPVSSSYNDPKFQPKTDRKKQPIGQDAEDFITETFGQEGDPNSWRNLPATQPQRDLLLKGNVFDIPATRGEASDKINDLLSSGALCDWLSLAELEAFDPKAGGRHKTERKFHCPNGCDQGKDRGLNVNTDSGAYKCWRCGAKGKLREWHTASIQIPTREFKKPEPEKTPADDKWKKWVADAKPIAGTSGADYIESRGIPTAAAAAAGVKFGRWWRRNEAADKPEAFDAVIFPIKNLDGEPVAAQARAIVGGDKRTKGEKSAGVFLATSGALDAKVIAVTEAPIDALALAAAGLDAIALCGTNWPAWLPDALAGCDVLLATDADAAGDQCASDLAKELQGRASIRRLRPDGVKDWAELADLEGLDSVRVQIAEVIGVGSKVETESQSASVPFLITRDQRQQLYDLGYTHAEVDAMRPADAHEILAASGAGAARGGEVTA